MGIKHKETYCCKRLRLLEYLLSKDFEPYATVPDANNYKYKNWLFHNSEELELALDEYFSMKK